MKFESQQNYKFISNIFLKVVFSYLKQRIDTISIDLMNWIA
jgi:hypothetical protein